MVRTCGPGGSNSAFSLTAIGDRNGSGSSAAIAAGASSLTSYGAFGAASAVSGLLPGQWPLVAQGTSFPPFRPQLEEDLHGGAVAIMHISAMQEYRNMSIDELRLLDYLMGRACDPGGSNSASGVFAGMFAMLPAAATALAAPAAGHQIVLAVGGTAAASTPSDDASTVDPGGKLVVKIEVLKVVKTYFFVQRGMEVTTENSLWQADGIECDWWSDPSAILLTGSSRDKLQKAREKLEGLLVDIEVTTVRIFRRKERFKMIKKLAYECGVACEPVDNDNCDLALAGPADKLGEAAEKILEAAPAFKLTMPPHWTNTQPLIDGVTGHMLERLASDGDEYCSVIALMGALSLRVKSIDRVQKNPFQYSQHKSLLDFIGGHRQLFVNADVEVAEQIITGGFNRTCYSNAREESSLGEGVVLGKDVDEMALDYEPNEEFVILVCSCALGETFVLGKPGLRDPSTAPEALAWGTPAYTAVNSLAEPSLFCLYKDHQAYPEYYVLLRVDTASEDGSAEGSSSEDGSVEKGSSS